MALSSFFFSPRLPVKRRLRRPGGTRPCRPFSSFFPLRVLVPMAEIWTNLPSARKKGGIRFASPLSFFFFSLVLPHRQIDWPSFPQKSPVTFGRFPFLSLFPLAWQSRQLGCRSSRLQADPSAEVFFFFLPRPRATSNISYGWRLQHKKGKIAAVKVRPPFFFSPYPM